MYNYLATATVFLDMKGASSNRPQFKQPASIFGMPA